MIIKNVIVFGVLIILTTSCFGLRGTHYHQYSGWRDFYNFEKRDLKEDGSIVLTRISNNILIKSDPIKKEYYSLGMAWVGGKINTDKTKELKFWYSNTLYSLKEKNEREIFYAKPGDYLLLSIGTIALVDIDNSGFGLLHHPKFIFYGRGSGFLRLKDNQTFIYPNYLLDRDREPLLASFTVKPGEIVYIGDINLSTSTAGMVTGNINFKIKDNYEEVVKDFKQKYPQFKNRLVVKRLVRLGNLIDTNGNAKFSIPFCEFLLGRFRSESVLDNDSHS